MSRCPDINSNDDQRLIERLRSIPLFSELTDDLLHELVPHLRYERWPGRKLIYSPCTRERRFHLLLEGLARAQLVSAVTGRTLALHLLRPGEGFNVDELFDDREHDVQVETIRASVAVSAPIEIWQQWLEHHPSLRHALTQCAAQRFREITALAGDLALCDTGTRLARLLLRETTKTGSLNGLTHEDIAHLIGSVRVVVNRLINRFRHIGILDTESDQLRIKDREHLERLAARPSP